MRTEFVYSLAALAAFPMIGSAQIPAASWEKPVTAQKDKPFEAKVKLARGIYKLEISDVSIPTDNALTLRVEGAVVSPIQTTVESGKTLGEFAFEIDADDTEITLTGATGDKDITFKPEIKLDYNFAPIVNDLTIEYNKLTQALKLYTYEGVENDIKAYSAYYDDINVIQKIAGGDYKAYKEETLGLKGMYATPDVTKLKLYTDIEEAFVVCKAKQKAYFDGDPNGVLTKYDVRFDALAAAGDKPDYQTDALKAAKKGAWDKLGDWLADPTTDNYNALLTAVTTYDSELQGRETVQKANEDAKAALDKELGSVYGYLDSYYAKCLETIDGQYTDPRYTELREELKTALNAIVTGTDYTTVVGDIKKSYDALTAAKDKNDLINEIAVFKQKISQKVSDFNTLKDQLTAAYDVYDEKDEEATKALDKHPAALDAEANAWTDEVGNLLTFIEAHDTEATIPGLTEDNPNLDKYVANIKARQDAYNAKKSLYTTYEEVMAPVTAQGEALVAATAAADKYANDAVKDGGLGLDAAEFKPSTIWETTIENINQQVIFLVGKVNSHMWEAAAYRDNKDNAYNDEYNKCLNKIKNDIAAFKANSKEASESYATIKSQIGTATDLSAALNDPAKDPKVDLTKLNVWNNQVTTDDAIKARTPYNKVINTTIAGQIGEWTTSLAAAPGKTGMYVDDPKDAKYKDNILGYLKSIAATPSSVLANEIATLNAIKANYESDEQAFKDQMEAQVIDGIRTMINGKAEILADQIKPLQDDLNDPKTDNYGNVKGAALQKEIDAINAKIKTATDAAADPNATKAGLNEQYDIISGLSADVNKLINVTAPAYEDAYTVFKNRYATLNGTDKDAIDEVPATVWSLTNKVKDQKDNVIKKLANLSDAQKDKYCADVDAVSVKKKEGDKEVTYTIGNINDFIADAKKNETLSADNVTKYQGIIAELRDATEVPATQAKKMNELEGLLKGVDFAAAEKKTLAKETGDPNTDGYWYKKLISTTDKDGYQKRFNDQKAAIEADTDITDAEYKLGGTGTYADGIAGIKNDVDNVHTKAKANLDGYTAQVNYLNATKDHQYKAEAGQEFYGLKQVIEEVGKPEYYSSAQAEHLTVLEGYYDKIAGNLTADEKDYNGGKFVDTDIKGDNTKIRKEINDLYGEYTNAVNVNAQISADNLKTYEDVKAAQKVAQKAYQTASEIINAYRFFRSTEMEAASGKAADELEALINELFDFEDNDNDIWKRAKAEYEATVSPDHYDADGSYEKEYNDLTATINAKKDAFLNKIEEFFGANVDASVEKYTADIDASKAKAKKFSADDKDVSDETIKGWYTPINNKLTAITGVAEDDVKKLDDALVAAADETTGIEASIVALEQEKAIGALTTLRDNVQALDPAKNLGKKDQNKFNAICEEIWLAENGNAEEKEEYRPYLVDNFDTKKAELVSLATTAKQNADITEAKTKAFAEIGKAQGALNDAYDADDDFVAGSEVKPILDEIKDNLSDYLVEDAKDVPTADAAQWEADAKQIQKDIEDFYPSLYDAEVSAVEALIQKAKEEQLTYASDPNNKDAADLKTNISNQEKNLETLVKNVTDKKVSKKDALGIVGGGLLDIQNALSGYIATMQTANQTSHNDAIYANLTSVKDDLDAAADDIFKISDKEEYSQDIQDALAGDVAAIKADIAALGTYLDDHNALGDLEGYEANAVAKIQDIWDELAEVQFKAAEMKQAEDEQAEADAQFALGQVWETIEHNIDVAQGQIDEMDAELAAYGSASKYANKVNQLKEQVATAQAIYDEAKEKAEAETTTAAKKKIADKTNGEVVVALDKLEENCADIIALAKESYIEEKIGEMRTILYAVTWNPDNYTGTDEQTLEDMWDAIDNNINDYGAQAYFQGHAEPTYNKAGKMTQPGVKKSLEDNKKLFDADVKALIDNLKAWTLEEDVRGHITGGETIGSDDIKALTDIIVQGLDNTPMVQDDLERYDVSGDGRVTVTDIIWLQYFWAFGEWPEVATAVRAEATVNNSDEASLQVVSTNGNITRLAVNLNNSDSYRAFQIGLQLPAGAKVVGQSLGERVKNAYLMHNGANEGNVRFVTIAFDSEFAGSEGAVLYVDVENLNGEVTMTEGYFTTTGLAEADLLNGNQATGIRETIANALNSATQKFFDVSGRMINSLKNGINIIRNNDGTSQKVLKK